MMHVVKQRKSDQFADRDKVVNAYMFRPEFLKQRKLWSVDVVLDSTSAVWPFLRLSLARYQPNSIPGKEFFGSRRDRLRAAASRADRDAEPSRSE